MNIALTWIGKTSFDYIITGIALYEKRISKYAKLTTTSLEPKLKKNLTKEQIKQEEGDILLKKISPNDTIVLLDERGKKFDSIAFADWLNDRAVKDRSTIHFIIGGAYGFSEAIYNRADYKISLSAMTFSHQIIRIIFLEQLYRGLSIQNNDPYHHA